MFDIIIISTFDVACRLPYGSGVWLSEKVPSLNLFYCRRSVFEWSRHPLTPEGTDTYWSTVNWSGTTDNYCDIGSNITPYICIRRRFFSSLLSIAYVLCPAKVIDHTFTQCNAISCFRNFEYRLRRSAFKRNSTGLAYYNILNTRATYATQQESRLRNKCSWRSWCNGQNARIKDIIVASAIRHLCYVRLLRCAAYFACVAMDGNSA